MSRVYIYAERNFAAVGAFLGACLIKEDIDTSRLTSLLKAYRYYKELLKAEKIIYLDRLIHIEDINASSIDHLYSKALDGLLLALNTTSIEGVRNKYCPYSNLFNLKIKSTLASPELRLTQYIVRSRRMGWIKKIANKYHPQFDWINNYGLDTYSHAKQVMLYGSDLTLHTESFLLNLAKYWLQGLREYDLDVITSYDYSASSPRWWSKLFGELDFLQCLSVEERYELQHLTGAAHINNPDISKYFKELKKDAHLSEGLSETTQQV